MYGPITLNEVQRLQKKIGEWQQCINEANRRIAKLEGNHYRKCAAELREEMTEALSNILLGEKIPLDVMNVETGKIIIPANRKITKTLLRKLASVYNHIEIDPSPIRIKIREIISVYKKRFEDLETKHHRTMDRLESGNDMGSAAAYSKGCDGERYVAELLGGEGTRPNSRFDVLLRRQDGTSIKLEVKFSKYEGQKHFPSSRRWTWGTLRGRDSEKSYDRLILIGPPDPRYSTRYKDKDPDAQYVLFDIPFSRVAEIEYQKGGLHLTSNPGEIQKRNKVGRELYEKWQVSKSELAKRSERWKKGGDWEI